jgi:gp32 DNA binding protein like
MALDLAKVKKRLEALKSTSSKSQHLWKPSPGKQVVRIVPYAHQPDNPFVELLFHYNMNGKTYLSPASFGRADPIVEFATKLKKSGDKEEWKTGRKLEPKMRTYVPVLVRGSESEGVKFWGMGKTVYEDILGIISDADYGDITDIKHGRDITVEFKTAEETGKSFPETNIRVKPNQTPAFDLANKEILEKVKNQKNITELFPELSYDELAAVMDTWLNASDATETEPAAVTTDDPVVADEPAEATTTAEAPAAAAAATAPKSVTQAKAGIKATSAKDVAAEFDDLFNK